jgi:plastocyanin
VLLATAALATIAGCGGGSASSPPTAPPNADLAVEALDLRFDSSAYSAAAGDITVAYLGIDRKAPHTLVIRDENDQVYGDKLRVTGGEVAVGSYELAPGEYELFCDVPGHYTAGMHATLTITAT